MRIRVSGIHTPLTDENRAYAEYRFFSAIAPYEKRVRTVAVAVRWHSTGRYMCTVTADLVGGGQIKTQARATHPSPAIDRAADRAAWLVGRRLGQHFSMKSSAFSS